MSTIARPVASLSGPADAAAALPGSTGHNRDLRDEIRDYWSDRAAQFDQDPGHRISAGREETAWRALLTRHLGPAEGRSLLDLASGTGEMTRLSRGLGFAVTGMDWSEEMLAQARAKLPEVPFLQADAERLPLPSDSVDVILTRHLVWTLVAPATCFAEWHRVLRPGGQLLVIDGDFVRRPRLLRWLGRVLLPPSPAAAHQPRHQAILSRLPFRDGARAEDVAARLAAAGFEALRLDTRLGAIHRAQSATLGWRRALLRQGEHRYALSARKAPAAPNG